MQHCTVSTSTATGPETWRKHADRVPDERSNERFWNASPAILTKLAGCTANPGCTLVIILGGGRRMKRLTMLITMGALLLAGLLPGIAFSQELPLDRRQLTGPRLKLPRHLRTLT